MTALAQDGMINEEALSVTELDRIYGGLTTKVQESLKKQEGLLKNIQVKVMYFSKIYVFKKLQKGWAWTKSVHLGLSFLQMLYTNRNP